jgi:hypothetical protein
MKKQQYKAASTMTPAGAGNGTTAPVIGVAATRTAPPAVLASAAASFVLGGEDKATARTSEKRVATLQVQLAEHVMRARKTEEQLIKLIEVAQAEHKAVLQTLGRKYGPVDQGKWNCDTDSWTFTQLEGPA